jgi:hypothetical protein
MIYFYIFLFISNLFFVLESKNSNNIQSIDDFNKIGFLEWSQDVLYSSKKKQQIINLFKKVMINEALREEMVKNIDPWALTFWLHCQTDLKNILIHAAYQDFRDSLTDEQISFLKWKRYFVIGKILVCYAIFLGIFVKLIFYSDDQQKKKKLNQKNAGEKSKK